MGEAKVKLRRLSDIVAREPRCIYCTNSPASVEHMPPISMFRTRSRPKGMEFAACTACNSGTSGADVVAAFLARISQSENPEMIAEAAALRGKLIKFAPGVFDEFRRPDKTERTWQRSASGLHRPMIKVQMDGPLTQAYLTVFGAKLGMALYREHVGEALPLSGGVQISCFLNAGLASRTAEGMLQKLPAHATLQQGKFVVPDQFAYRYNYDGKSIVAALAGFNSNLHIFVVATSQPEFYHFPISAPNFHFARPGQLTAMMPSRQTDAA